MKDRQLDALETLFKALADRTRLRILGLLAGGEVCVCDIHESLGLPQPTTSRHLAYLRKAGLVTARKEGLWVRYRLTELPLPLTAAVLDAVGHALGHVAASTRDRRRLADRLPPGAEGNAACCAPATGDPVRRVCCEPAPVDPAHGARR